jgi:hypothetical protein|tara:strand:- start:45 stop:572 length:528 start_codon:yes stop_codon:yes gene_type:complete
MMFCRENLEIEIHYHPHYQSLNKKLMDDFSKLSFYSYENTSNYTNIKGSQFGFTGDDVNLKPRGVTLIENWVEQIVRDKLSGSFNFRFGTWAARLDKNQETLEHSHLHFCTLAFVYFVNTPKGSSPLVFPTSGKKIKAESGKLVLFPPSLSHKVPINKCDNRVTIASNVTILEIL